MSAAGDSPPFQRRTVLLVIAAAVIAFLGFLLLVAFAPDPGRP